MNKQIRKGLRCSKCDSSATGVVLTRHGHRHTTRIRRCFKCQHRFKTFEINAEHLPTDRSLDFMFRRTPTDVTP